MAGSAPGSTGCEPERAGPPPAAGRDDPPAGAATTKSARRSALESHRDVLRLQVLVDALVAALAPEAGLLDAAERRAGVGDHALVETHHAGVEALADAERPLEVLRVDVGDEAVLRVVG